MDLSPINIRDGRLRVRTREPNSADDCRNFWLAVKKLEVSVIVMVKNCSYFYFPNQVDEEITYRASDGSPISIRLVSCEVDFASGFPFCHVVERTFLVDGKKVHHIQIDWPDMKGIDPLKLLTMTKKMYALEAQNPGATLVHCLAGLGRTGTFFGALVIEQLLQHIPISIALRFNPALLVVGLRQQCSGSIQAEEQVLTLHDYFVLRVKQKLAELAVEKSTLISS